MALYAARTGSFDPEAIFLGLGSNLGRRRSQIEAALEALGRQGVSTVRRSSFYQTEPIGLVDQPLFINQVAQAATGLGPRTLLELCHQVEASLGRVRTRKWGPRTVDIDLLYYGQSIFRLPDLALPHPEVWRRRFVLEPLAEIAPDFRDPVSGRTVGEMLELERLGSSEGSRVR